MEKKSKFFFILKMKLSKFISLEPEFGFPHLLKYELKLIQNKDFELSPFKADEIEKLRRIYKALLDFKQ